MLNNQIHSKVEAIIFDLGNVLVKIDYQKFLENLSLNGKYTEIEIYNLLAEPAILYEKGIINSKTFYEKSIEKIALSIDYKHFYYAWCSVVSELVDGIDKVVDKLNKKFPLYLLSNTNEAHMKYIQDNFKILKYFKEYFLSYKIGSMKPEKEIYEYMLGKLNFKPEELFYIDDKLENVKAAQEFGIHSYNFINSNELIKHLQSINLME